MPRPSRWPSLRCSRVQPGQAPPPRRPGRCAPPNSATTPPAKPTATPAPCSARYEVDQAFRVGGKVAQRKVDVGQVVREGDILAVLDDTDYRLAEDAARQQWHGRRLAGPPGRIGPQAPRPL